MFNFIKSLQRKRIVYTFSAVIATVVLVVVLFCSGSKQQSQILKVVETETSQRLDISQTKRFMGTVKPKHFCIVVSKSSGTIDTIAQAGTIMKKDEIIAKIENIDIEKTYELCLSAEQIAVLQYDRVKKLEKSGVSSKGNLEDKERALIDAKKALATAKIEYDNIHIKAPFDGVLGVYKIKDGEHIQVGEQIVSFYDPQTIIIDFDVPGDYVNDIQDGQTVFANGKRFKLTHIQRAIDEEKHMCPAYIEFENKDNWIAGSSVEVDLVIQEHKNTIVLNKSAVFIKDGQNYVYVIKDQTTELRKVTLGIQEKNTVEIIDGLKEGEEIVSRGQDRLYPGARIIIAKNEKNG